jgi:hypothetical protein
MKRKKFLLVMAVLAAAFLALSGVAQSAMWVGAEIGGNFVPDTKFKISTVSYPNTPIPASVIGGVTIGYDCVNAGFGAYEWPDWMKYFSVATDLTYNRLVVSASTTGLGQILPPGSKLNGYAVTWSLLFIAHYGLFPDAVIPTGRVNPYIGVGPAILFSGLGNLDSSATAALVVEPGIRWMAFPKISIDTAFRYRYGRPTYGDVEADSISMFSFLVRANYHF